MKQRLRKVFVTAILLAAVLGSVLGIRGLNQAMTRANNLYRVDTAGSQMESDLEFETQESRRAFVYALAVSDPNDQLPYVVKAREASQHVDQSVNRLRLLGVPEITGNVEDFERVWTRYDEARDDIMALILVGNSAGALRMESVRGQPAFGLALESLHALKAALALRAQADSRQVNDLCAVASAD